LGGDVEKMKTKGKVTIAVMLIVALVATMAFMSAMGTPIDTTSKIKIAYPDIDIAYRVDSNVTGEEGTRATYNIDGGWLKVDESQGTPCSGNAQSWNLYNVPSDGASCKIAVDYTYKDTDDIGGGLTQYAKFVLNPPEGTQAKRQIRDEAGPDNSETGVLPTTFIVYPNSHYQFTIHCERTGHGSFDDTGDIYTYA
jgi:hypothetical protein